MAKIVIDSKSSTTNDVENKSAINNETIENSLDKPQKEKIVSEEDNYIEKVNDPNKINVNIADKDTPLVILFGPPNCGKTMTLIRLTRYLKKEGYVISPIRTFRPSNDKNYQKRCDEYDSKVSLDNAAESTALTDFMLIEILKNGKRLCQILEAPGEGFFDPMEPKRPFRNYVNTIINSNNRKIWCIMVEPDWGNMSDRIDYVSRIHLLKTKMRLHDKIIFIFNKIDKTNFIISPGHVNLRQAHRDIENLYPGIFAPFRNMNPITRFFSEGRYDFIPFQTGDFTKSITDLTYQEGPREYPAKLWNTIIKRIKG